MLVFLRHGLLNPPTGRYKKDIIYIIYIAPETRNQNYQLTKCDTMRSLNKSKRVNLKSHVYIYYINANYQSFNLQLQRANKNLYKEYIFHQSTPFLLISNLLVNVSFHPSPFPSLPE